ncbi:hypothetical protein B2G71_06155 [Novosphingobium sp. PC22D]|uniref:sensor histidine kinase n=1 Tax=Novosphingobium sp. PC22D TaxID=1962403 RepID=UPI000BFB0B10|nr:PAS domain-containing protein [Novosphingobium sp. PC22D]PEQ14044.1 hypothetical protein B2G71_06155 [Novosphingobium sp. PC22D]
MTKRDTRNNETPGEQARLEVLARYPRAAPDLQSQLDRFARLAAQICKAPVGLVSIVEQDRQVFVGRSGTELLETPRDWSFCAHAMLRDDAMIVPDATIDARFRDNPLVTGQPGIRFYAGQPLVSAEGMPLGSFCVIDTEARGDLTPEQREGLETLSIAAMGLLEKAREESSSEDFARSSSNRITELQQRFEFLSNAMPQLVWMTDAEGRVDYLNRRWIEFVGLPAEKSLGSRWLDHVHPDDRAHTSLAWREATDAGQLYETEYRLRHADGEHRWVLARGMPMLREDGRPSRWIGTCTDIHEQRESAERLEILSRELNHRIKNIFAVIGGLISMTLRGAPEIREKGSELQARVLALGRAHDFVRTHRGEEIMHKAYTSLQDMLAALLEPYQGGEVMRIEISGADVQIDDRSATPLALYFHELATNAAKYGALSTDEGAVSLTLRHADDDIVMIWQERGGPAIAQNAEKGFGAKLIELSIGRQLGGSLDYDWTPEGLCVTATVPMRLMAR